MRLGNIEVPDLQTWLRSRRIRWEDLRRDYDGRRMERRKFCSVEELTEVLNDCETLADALIDGLGSEAMGVELFRQSLQRAKKKHDELKIENGQLRKELAEALEEKE